MGGVCSQPVFALGFFLTKEDSTSREVCSWELSTVGNCLLITGQGFNKLAYRFTRKIFVLLPKNHKRCLLLESCHLLITRGLFSYFRLIGMKCNYLIDYVMFNKNNTDNSYFFDWLIFFLCIDNTKLFTVLVKDRYPYVI